MNGLTYSKHARMRTNHRGVNQAELDVILEFGKKKRCRDGGLSYFMTKRTCQNAQRALGPAYTKLNDNIRKKVVIVSENSTVITVLNRTGRKLN